MSDVIIVGGGLFGQVIAGNLRLSGFSVKIIDARKPLNGSAPSASLMKPSWLASMNTVQLDRAFEVLDNLYGVQDLSFKVGPLKVDTVRWCNPKDILAGESTWAQVEQITDDNAVIGLEAGKKDSISWQAPIVVLAMGVWTNYLHGIHVPQLQSKMGASIFYDKTVIDEPFIKPWAPYKQLTAFNMNGGTWVGDSSAILKKNWTEERREQTVTRCRKAVNQYEEFGNPTGHTIKQGARPYVPKKHMEGQPCYLERRKVLGGRSLWIATGGAKNGTIAAGWAAAHIAEREL